MTFPKRSVIRGPLARLRYGSGKKPNYRHLRVLISVHGLFSKGFVWYGEEETNSGRSARAKCTFEEKGQDKWRV